MASDRRFAFLICLRSVLLCAYEQLLGIAQSKPLWTENPFHQPHHATLRGRSVICRKYLRMLYQPFSSGFLQLWNQR